MDLELSGKVVMVTGGSNGLGLALCRRLAGEGAFVAMCARDEERLRFAADDVRGDGGEVLDVVADVTVPAQLARFVELTTTRFGRIDGLVNNAGQAGAMAVADSDDTAWQADLDLKLFAALRLIRLALPALVSTEGSIVNVLAIAAKAPGARSTPSAVSRSAGLTLTKALSKEVGPEGVRVNAVLPGLLRSGQWERVAKETGASTDDLYERMATDAGIPLGRIGRSAEFADLVTYLLSARSSYITGTAINLDGGLCPVV